LFKVGTKEKQHLVAIQPDGQGSLFQLVYVEARGDEKDKKALYGNPESGQNNPVSES
jgi:hypothetical protein